MMNDSLNNAKINLYHELLSIANEKLTSDEVNIGFLLSRDAHIQKVLTHAREELIMKQTVTTRKESK